jgi:hypothetical protein
MIICDLCGDAKDCLQKEIEGKEYDICSECWNPWTMPYSYRRQTMGSRLAAMFAG